MNLKNIIGIGKGLGTLFKVDRDSGKNWTFKSYFRLLVEIDVTQPLKVGFSLKREGEPLWIFLKYERVDIYCTLCGRIGHKLQSYRAPLEEQSPKRYAISLKVNIFSNLPPNPITALGYLAGASSSQSFRHGNELT